MTRKLIHTLTGTEYTINRTSFGVNTVYLDGEELSSYSDKEVLSYIFLGLWIIKEV